MGEAKKKLKRKVAGMIMLFVEEGNEKAVEFCKNLGWQLGCMIFCMSKNSFVR